MNYFFASSLTSFTANFQIEENGESEGPPTKIPLTYNVPPPYGIWMQRGSVPVPVGVGGQNIRGRGFRGNTVGPWRGSPRGMPNYNHRGYFRGNRGRGPHPRYNNYDPQQVYQVLSTCFVNSFVCI